MLVHLLNLKKLTVYVNRKRKLVGCQFQNNATGWKEITAKFGLFRTVLRQNSFTAILTVVVGISLPCLCKSFSAITAFYTAE